MYVLSLTRNRFTSAEMWRTLAIDADLKASVERAAQVGDTIGFGAEIA